MVFVDKKNRQLLLTLAKRNLKLKYKGAFLGYLWSLITPIVYLLVFDFVFSRAFPDIENYELYIITGIIFWLFFVNATNQTIQCFIRNSSIIKSVNIPLSIFPISTVLTEIFGLFFTLGAFLLLMFYLDFQISWVSLLIFPFIALFSSFILGISVFLGVLNVYFRDIAILWSTISTVLFYFSPIAYSNSIIPDKYLWILQSNPLYFFFEAVHKILYNNVNPSLNIWLAIIIITLVMNIVGWITYYKLRPGIISNL